MAPKGMKQFQPLKEVSCGAGCGNIIVAKRTGKLCNDCTKLSKITAHEKRKQHPEYKTKLAASVKAWQQSEKGRAYYANPLFKAKQKSERIKKAYGLTPEQYVELLDKHNNQCALPQCGNTEDLVIDHDHACCPGSATCGYCIRGVLCRQCNAAIGKLGDTKESILNVLAYLDTQVSRR